MPLNRSQSSSWQSTLTKFANFHIQPPNTRDNYHLGILRRQQVTASLISRLGLEKELKGHTGCVNCLEWSHDGSLLASGSDDCCAIVWDPHRHRMLTRISTGHTGNIFSVNFMPHSNNATLVSGAADSRVIVSDVSTTQPVFVYQCHRQRVKRLATARDSSNLFWSASEDGTVRQFDLRDKDTGPESPNVLVDLSCLLSQNPEVKCLSVNPCRSEILAVGANDHCVRVFDRRKLSLTRPKSRSQQQQPSGSSTAAGLTSETPLGDADSPDPRTYVEAGQYYIPGQLTREMRPRRHVAVTYLTFSADGRHLVANLGGEQVYTVPVTGTAPQPAMRLRPDLILPASSSNLPADAGGRNGGHVTPSLLPAAAQELKVRANRELEAKRFAASVRLYTEALQLAPGDPVLLGNRAAALLKRRWDGDVYAAALDCEAALAADPGYYKALFRLTRAFVELGWSDEAKQCLAAFKQRFSEHTTGASFRDLAADAAKAGEDRQQRQPGSHLLRGFETPQPRDSAEAELRSRALDLRHRFVGHCNTTTDIKEANFFGQDFLVAGSDEGNFFVWNRNTGSIVRVLRGDESIVNCLQPHPTSCLLATSGLDPVVRLWSPQPVSDDSGDSSGDACQGIRDSPLSTSGRRPPASVGEVDDAVDRNQRLMRSDPLELMLRSMGYRVNNSDDENDDAPAAAERNCRPS